MIVSARDFNYSLHVHMLTYTYLFSSSECDKAVNYVLNYLQSLFCVYISILFYFLFSGASAFFKLILCTRDIMFNCSDGLCTAYIYILACVCYFASIRFCEPIQNATQFNLLISYLVKQREKEAAAPEHFTRDS